MTANKEADELRDQVAFAVNHMEMSDAAYLYLLKAVELYDRKIKSGLTNDDQIGE